MERLNQWITLLANIGVLIGVFVVAYELRQNTIAMEANTRQEFAAHDLDYLATNLDASVLAVALAKSQKGDQLSSLESSQLIERQHMNFRIFENAYYQYRKGMLETHEWNRYAQIVRSLICGDDRLKARSMWNQFQSNFVPEFVEVVERISASCSG